jgi:hypothetical protein
MATCGGIDLEQNDAEGCTAADIIINMTSQPWGNFRES